MNILYITNHLNIGGITSYVLTLAAGMKKKGHNVYVASSGGGCLEKFTKAGIQYIPIPIKTKQDIGLKVFLSRHKLLKALKEERIDILHSHSRTTQVLACLVSKKTGIPYISTCHGFFKPRFFRRAFPCWGKKVIAISEQVKEHLIKDFKVKEENIAVIHNGINIERFRRTTNDERRTTKLNLGLKDEPVLGIVARLSDVKGHIYLIQAMKEVVAQIPEAQLLIVGEGKMKDGLVKLSKELGIEKNIFFLPEAPDTPKVLAAMDLFVLPSLREGLGLALMEAMASGLAVIGSDIGGIRSLIQDNKTGLLVKPADSQSLAAKILALLKDPQKREVFGSAAQEFIAESFSQEKMVSETEKVYLECLSAKD